METLNIAQRCKEYYENDDFINNYRQLLFEMYNENEGDVINSIIEIIQHEYYFEKRYGFNKLITKEQAKVIYDYISNNFELFESTMSNYYVGHGCLESVDFGEQEEKLIGLYNHRTGKDYTMKYLRYIFNKEDYTINRDYAYYNLSGDGIQVNLLHGDLSDILNKFNQ